MGKNNKSRNYDRGISLNGVSVALLFISTFLLVCTFFSGFSVYKRYRELVEITNKYVLSQSDIMDLEQGSDYLTEQARTFIVTDNPIYLIGYVTETNVTRRRNNAVENMRTIMGQESSSLIQLERALGASDYLSRIELHAMKLKCLALHMTEDEVPPAVWDFQLSDQEMSYTDKELNDSAFRFLFGKEYSKEKSRIWMNLELASKALEQAVTKQKEASSIVFRRSVFSLIVFMLISVLLNVGLLGMLHGFISKPTRKMIESIKTNSFMPIVGTKEFKYLEKSYNDMFEYNETSKLELEYQAMHDSLTGLFNRNAFDKMCQILTKRKEPTAVIILDVDLFKQVNDRYGHSTGDMALQRVSDLLKRFFRNEDRIVRYGGDEFVLILTDIDYSKASTIRHKIQDINMELQTPQDELPSLSISAGCAFSLRGYSEQLFTNADIALYETKAKGRCGCTIYEKVL